MCPLLLQSFPHGLNAHKVKVNKKRERKSQMKHRPKKLTVVLFFSVAVVELTIDLTGNLIVLFLYRYWFSLVHSHCSMMSPHLIQ